MMPDRRITWGLARLLSGTPLTGELDAVSGPYRVLLDHLADLPVEARQEAFAAFLTSLPPEEQTAVNRGRCGARPGGIAASRRHCRLDTVLRRLSKTSPRIMVRLNLGSGASGSLLAFSTSWPLTPESGKLGSGSTWPDDSGFGLSWPDNQTNELPAKTRTLWVQGDRNFAEMASVRRRLWLARGGGRLGSSPDDATGRSVPDTTPLDLGRVAEVRIVASGVETCR